MASFVNYCIFQANKEDKGKMFDTLSNLNWEVIFQLVSVGLIVIAGPVVIFLLALRNGNM
jgi:uncharacterized membrane protein YukC